MAGRGRFKIPSEDELAKDKPVGDKAMSLFANYKLKKPSETTAEDKGAGKNSTSASGADPARSIQPASGSAFKRPGSTSSTSTTSTISSSTHTTSASAQPTATPAPDPASSTTPAVPAGAKSGTGTGNSIIVNFRQRGNPILKHIRNVPWEYGSIVPDYVLGKANCALFLSLRYHQLHPAYLHNRLKELGKGYDLRVLLAQIDVPDPHHILKDLAKICILADLTLILAFTCFVKPTYLWVEGRPWLCFGERPRAPRALLLLFSPEEAGRYLESYKVYENKPAEALMERTDTDFMSKVNDCLTTVKAVNKTDCMTLMSSFKSIEGIVNASKEDLSICAGFGPHKAQRLHNVLHESFVKGRKRRSGSPAKGEQDPSTSPTKKPG